MNGKNYLLKIIIRYTYDRLSIHRYNKANQEGEQEHQRLSRILDVAQELKALSVLLTTNLWPFVIDLAVLAARREYLNLDKWLADQLQVNHPLLLLL